MKVAALVNVHDDLPIMTDTIESLEFNLTKDILVVFDGYAKDRAINFMPHLRKIVGFEHGLAKSPYRNIALGLKKLYEFFPDSDWFCYTEYDSLFTSRKILDDLEKNEDIWLLGCELQQSPISMRTMELMLKFEFKDVRSILGCCLFFSKKYMEKLEEIDFFNRFLWYTNAFERGFFPEFVGYDISEHIYPTLAIHLGGKVKELSHWDNFSSIWRGDFKKYSIRWRPQIEQFFPESVILHPIKNYDDHIRQYFRRRRF